MNQERIMKVLVAPIVSEKSTRLADENRQFVFKVVKDASKPEVSQAVELMFDVNDKAVPMYAAKPSVLALPWANALTGKKRL